MKNKQIFITSIFFLAFLILTSCSTNFVAATATPTMAECYYAFGNFDVDTTDLKEMLIDKGLDIQAVGMSGNGEYNNCGDFYGEAVHFLEIALGSAGQDPGDLGGILSTSLEVINTWMQVPHPAWKSEVSAGSTFLTIKAASGEYHFLKSVAELTALSHQGLSAAVFWQQAIQQ